MVKRDLPQGEGLEGVLALRGSPPAIGLGAVPGKAGGGRFGQPLGIHPERTRQLVDWLWGAGIRPLERHSVHLVRGRLASFGIPVFEHCVQVSW